MALTDEQKSKYINLGGLSTFWANAKDYIDVKFNGLPDSVTGFKATVTGLTNYSGLITVSPTANTTGAVTLTIGASSLDSKLKSIEDNITSLDGDMDDVKKIATDDDINAIFS